MDKILGEEAEIARFEQLINHLQDYLNKYNLINQDVITQLNQGKPLFEPKQENLILYGVNGKPILARTINQQKLVKAYENNDLLFAVGPAGTGKTYTAIALAVRAFKNKEYVKYPEPSGGRSR